MVYRERPASKATCRASASWGRDIQTPIEDESVG